MFCLGDVLGSAGQGQGILMRVLVRFGLEVCVFGGSFEVSVFY